MRLDNAWLTALMSNNRLLILVIPGNCSLKKLEQEKMEILNS